MFHTHFTPKRRRAAAAGLALAALAALASAAAAAGPRVTLYTNDLGFVRESRTFALAAARDTVRLTDVPERIDFTSVRLVPSDASQVTRLAYRYDVASGAALVDRARGSRVRVTSRGERQTEGVLVASDGEWLVVRTDDGALQTLARAAVESVRLATPPASLSLRPTLEAVIENGKRGTTEAEFSYLTGGLSWTAEHVLVRRGEDAGTWSTRVTLDNSTGRDFVDASVQLVAGNPNRVAPSAPRPIAMMARAADGEALKSADMSEESFADYHLYTLDRPATLRNQEQQSLSMVEPRPVKVTPKYLYRVQDPRGVRTTLETKNDAANGLGLPLPGGRVRVFEADAAGRLQFTGESSIGHTATGEKVTVDVGQAFDLVAETRTVSEKRISDREHETSWEVKLRNQKKGAVTIGVEASVGGDFDVTQQSSPSTKKDANTLHWDLAVPAGKETVLTYTVRVRY